MWTIASIVAIKLFMCLKQISQGRLVKCITFGAPLIGDRVLRESAAKQMGSCIHHFVHIKDPVPHLLRYTQSVVPWLEFMNKCLPVRTLNKQNAAIISSEEGTRNTLVAIEDSYSKAIETIDLVLRMVDKGVQVAPVLYPDYPPLKQFRNIFKLIGNLTTAIKYNRNVYIPIGNFHFLSEDDSDNKLFSWDRLEELEKYMEKNYQQNVEKIIPNRHALSEYTELFQNSRKFSFKNFSSVIEIQHTSTHATTHFDDNIQLQSPFEPIIDSVELTKAEEHEKAFLRLSFTGKYIHDVVLDLCRFDFDFPFAKEKEKVKIIKPSMVGHSERLVFEQEMDVKDIEIPENGIVLQLVTQFGECEKIIRSEDMSKISVRVRQIAENDSVSLVVKRAIQRSIALKKIKNHSNCNTSEQIIGEIVKLGSVAIGEDLMKKKKTEIFTEYVENIDHVFSNEESVRNVKKFCDEIEEFIRSPLFINARLTANQKIQIGLSAITGGAIAGFVVDRSTVSIGLAEATSKGIVCLGGAAGVLAAGTTATYLSTDQLTDGNYKNALEFIVMELFEAQKESLSAIVKAEIMNLKDENNFFSKKKALIRLVSKNVLQTDILENCAISKSTKKSKEEIIKRIEAIQSIHRIREIFSQQCFIGVVGLQNSGKTTLIKKIWNIGGKPGNLNHTLNAEMYQITQKVIVVDFPGNDCLRHYSKTFSVCGAMNNMIIAVIPFSGDANKNQTQEIAKIFAVKKGSKSTKVILCINKCGSFLAELRQELSLQQKPVDYLKQDFVNKLNDYYEENEISVHLSEADILFTDWELERNQESLDFGINGVEEIKQIIRDYLVDYGIYESTETDELHKCVSFVSN